MTTAAKPLHAYPDSARKNPPAHDAGPAHHRQRIIPIIAHDPRQAPASQQGLLPARYPLAIQILAFVAFTLAFAGWLNESWLFLFDNPIWLNRYTEYAIILGFGVWRIHAEQNRYTRLRLTVLVAMVTVFWWLIPWLTPFFEPYVGYLWAQPVFPALHVPGTITFFLVLAAVFLFGRRVICGWNCPCVGVRETVGFAFRDRTVRGKWAWRLRHTKWLFFVFYVGVMVVTQYPPSSWTVSFVGLFYLVVALTYFGTFFIAPIVGNRFYCRYLCPYGATFGLLNHAGFYGIRMDKDKCNDCRRCEQVCDMGIPVWEQGKQHGRITGIEDCMGCGRCVVSCPTDALEIRDVRNLFKPGLVQNGSHLMKSPPVPTVARRTPDLRPAAERRHDHREIYTVPSLAHIQEQAARCLDCGVPGCRDACPLTNRIPDWLQAAAKGDIARAADIMHATNPLPEVCSRLCPQHRLCEGACTRAKDGGAVAIGVIEQYISDTALARGWRPAAPAARNGRKIAIIGAGPAGLACADLLNRTGHRVTVYDQNPAIGGLLASGVPPFKLEKPLLTLRQTLWRQAGVDFRLGTPVDSAGMRELIAEHAAVFLGTGAQAARAVKLQGMHLPGVHQALDYLNGINAGQHAQLKDRRVVVLGSGDTAMDCARGALRDGATSVTVVSRGGADGLRASAREAEAARAEGVAFLFRHLSLEILGDVQIRGVRFDTPDGEQTVPCDAVVLAFGFMPAAQPWLAPFAIACDASGRIQVDAHGRTSHPKVYAGGDAASGPDLVVTALAAGRRAAQAIAMDLAPWRRIRMTGEALLARRRAGPSAAPFAARQGREGAA
jgi:glutamate synthase (NADPH/NADH) small chain